MSNQSSVTVVLAIRPRLFRELLQHALSTGSPQFRVVEAADSLPTRALLQEADWLIVDEDAATEAAKLSANYPNLNILALGGRGGSARVLAPEVQNKRQQLSEVPTLSELFSLLSQKQAISNANVST